MNECLNEWTVLIVNDRRWAQSSYWFMLFVSAVDIISASVGISEYVVSRGMILFTRTTQRLLVADITHVSVLFTILLRCRALVIAYQVDTATTEPLR